jgi:hypothetical protein
LAQQQKPPAERQRMLRSVLASLEEGLGCIDRALEAPRGRSNDERKAACLAAAREKVECAIAIIHDRISLTLPLE